jgi:hypothetical protein
VEHEGQSLRGGERLEHDQQRQADGVGEHRFFLRSRLADDRLGQPRAGTLLSAGSARAEHVEADPADDHRQPGPEVGRAAGVVAVQPNPRLLDRVLSLAD